MSVADSPSEMAVNMKAQVHELLARGYTEEQILKYFELSYGQFVLLRPKFEGVNRLVWLLPVGALLLGAAVVFVKLKKLENGAPVTRSQAQAATAATDDPYLVARARPRRRRTNMNAIRTDWVSAIAILAAGLVLGALFSCSSSGARQVPRSSMTRISSARISKRSATRSSQQLRAIRTSSARRAHASRDRDRGRSCAGWTERAAVRSARDAERAT